MTVQPAPAYNQTLPDQAIPYITRDQYRCAPTGMDWQNIVRSTTQADQDAALDRLILAASKWCDTAAEQPLTAQAATETMRAQVTRSGTVRLHPRQHPIVMVTGLSYGADPGAMTALTDLTSVWVENQSVELPIGTALAAGWVGPLQFGRPRTGSKLYLALSYVAGYSVTTAAAPINVGDMSIQVVSSLGIVPGTTLRIEQGGAPTGQGSQQGTLTQRAVTVASLVGNVVTLTGPVGAAFTAGAAVTAMPPEVEQAAIYVTTALLKQAGVASLTMGNASATVSKEQGPAGAEELDAALAILEYYRPVAP